MAKAKVDALLSIQEIKDALIRSKPFPAMGPEDATKYSLLPLGTRERN